MKLLKILLLFLLFIFSACGTLTYSNLDLNLQQNNQNKKIAIAVLDKRPYVLNLSKSKSYVAIIRGGYGNPWHKYLTSGLPLATELTTSLKTSFEKSGYIVESINLSGDLKISSKDAALRFKETGASKILIFSLNEWRSDTFADSWFMYDVNLDAYNNHGKLLTKENISGKDEVKGSFWWPWVYETRVPMYSKTVLEKLIGKESIQKALK